MESLSLQMKLITGATSTATATTGTLLMVLKILQIDLL